MRKLKQRLCSLLLCAALAAGGEGGGISDGTAESAILSIFARTL